MELGLEMMGYRLKMNNTGRDIENNRVRDIENNTGRDIEKNRVRDIENNTGRDARTTIEKVLCYFLWYGLLARF